MRFAKRLKAKAKALKKELTVLYYAYRKPETGLLPKLLILAALGYALSPFDLIPDFIPVLGHLDDLIVVPFLITLSIKFIPEEILAVCRKEAEERPLSLKKNWITGLVFLAIWMILLIFLVKIIWKILSGVF